MKIFSILPIAAVFGCAVFGAPIWAQDNAPGATIETPASPENSGSKGTSPAGMGSTGWTGGSRGQTKPDDVAEDDLAVRDQPLTATGVDLNGTPRRYPPGKTPE